jgi:hypothetical protein
MQAVSERLRVSADAASIHPEPVEDSLLGFVRRFAEFGNAP